MVDQKEIRGQKSLCSLLVHVEEDESLRSGTLMTETLPSVRLTRWQGCCRFDSLLALVEAVIVHDRVQLRVVGMKGQANSLFEEAIYHDSSNLLRQEVRASL